MSEVDEQISREKSDAELVAAAKCGHLQAFGELVERSQGLARAVAYSASGDMASVEDLVQEALVTAWTRLSDLGDPAAFRPWLAGIVRNTVRYWRRHQRRHAPRAQAGMDTLSTLASAAPSPLDDALWLENWQHTSEALQKLPSKYREPLVLYYSLGESHAHVAHALGLTEASARQRVHRARKRLASEVSSVASGARQLAGRASAAAGVLLVIQSRQAWAAAPACVPTSAASLSPKFFVAAGVLGGAAMVACIVGFVMLISGESESMGSTNVGHRAPDPNAAAMTPTVIPVLEHRATTPAETTETASVSLVGGRVSIGRGRVGDDAPVKSVAPTSASTRTPITEAQNHSETRESRKSNHWRKTGRIKKHGPAILHEEERRPLLVPDIDMQAVRREFWQ